MYRLVNPFISGKFNNVVKEKNEVAAAKKMYEKMSKMFNNNIPSFIFTIEKITDKDNQYGGGTKKNYFHFKVTEKKDDDKINFKISPYEGTNNKKLTKFKEKLKKKVKQQGGDKGISDESNLDWLDDEDDIKSSHSVPVSPVLSVSPTISITPSTPLVITDNSYFHPIYNWWYDPNLYLINQLYVPTFVSSVTPYVEIDLHVI